MSDKEIAKEIVMKLIDHDGLAFNQFPEAKSYVDLVCIAYKQVLKTVQEG